MRQKQIVRGLNNSQRIRVIVNGVGFGGTIDEILSSMCFTEQRVAVWRALEVIARERITGYGGQNRVYDGKMQVETVSFQVDLV
jgi:hypothetical protein